MGGTGSGRHWHWGTKSTTSEFRSIDVRRWAREGFLTPGRRFSWQWTQEGEVVAQINASVERGYVNLSYRSRDYGEEWESHDYPVRLLAQPCHYGGNRQWFACPARGCGRRVAKLYGGRLFACRHCHQLVYPVQREAAFQRNQRRADKIRERLAWVNDPDPMEVAKPKGMHWRTYNRLVAELEHWEEASNSSLIQYLDRLAWEY